MTISTKSEEFSLNPILKSTYEYLLGVKFDNKLENLYD